MKPWNRLLVFVAALILLTSCGGGGGGGGGILPTPPGGGTPNLTNGEGSAQQPVSVNAGASRASYVGNISYSYYTFTTGAAGTYVISLNNPTVDVSWSLYGNSDFVTDEKEWCDDYWSVASESCAVALDAGTPYYLKVMQWGLSGGTFTLNITLLSNDGSLASPITLTVGTPYHGSVETSGRSYYRFRPSVDGACFEYTTTLTTGKLLFSVKTSAANYNGEVFYIDGFQTESWMASTPWRRVQFSTTSGSHTFKWCYEKDSSTVTGSDAAWVDDIEFN